MYNFDNLIDRHNTNSIKWKGLPSDTSIPMCLADMDFTTPLPISAALENRVAHNIYGYTGYPENFYEIISAWVKRRYHWDIKDSWIAMNQGVVTSLCTIIRALSDPGDKIIIQSPVYHPFFSVIQNNQRVVVDNTLLFDGVDYQMDFDLLATQVKDAKLLILCNPHNPVGRVWTAEELTKLGNICLENGVIVISDDIHADFTWSRPYTPFASLSADFADMTVTCMSPSKTFNIAGLNISYEIVANHVLRDKIRREKIGCGNTHQNLFAYIALEQAYTACDEWLDELLKYLDTSRSLMCRHFKDTTKINLISPPEGTYLAWLDCRQLRQNSDDIVAMILRDAQVRLTAGNIFGTSGNEFLRMNFATNHATLVNGMTRVINAINRG